MPLKALKQKIVATKYKWDVFKRNRLPGIVESDLMLDDNMRTSLKHIFTANMKCQLQSKQLSPKPKHRFSYKTLIV